MDALVIGGGLAGLASAIHLSRGGLSVLGIEQHGSFHSIVGESLDWSAPDLLADLGLPTPSLLASECATLKRHVAVTSYEGDQEEYLPGAWLAASPWNVELATLHLDRLRIHEHRLGQ